MKDHLNVVGGSVFTLLAASAAIAQTAPRVDYRVLAEVGTTASGPWPVVNDTVFSPQLMVQFADGGVMWYYSRMYSITDDGAVEVLQPGTVIPGLPAGELRFSFNPFQQQNRAYELSDGRSAYYVTYRAVVDGGPSGFAWILGTPREPELAEIRGIESVSPEGDILRSNSPISLVGPFGGELAPFVAQNTPVTGAAPAGRLLNSVDGSRQPRVGPAGLMSFAAFTTMSESFQAVLQDGVVRAVTFRDLPVPGVSTPISAFSVSIDAMMADGTVLMSRTSGVPGAWLVYPDGTGRDIVTTTTPLPGYPAGTFAAGSTPFATADGRVYLRVSEVTDGSQTTSVGGLYEFENNALRPIVITGDPRLRSPLGQTASAMRPQPRTNAWSTSEGRFAWLDSNAIILADRRGVVVPAIWKNELSPGVLARFGRVEDMGTSTQLDQDLHPIGTDMPGSTNRMARDGSLAFWVLTRDATTNQRRSFVVSARLNVCLPDINEDGFIDFFDYDAFVGCFESGERCGRFNVGDFNQDGFTDFFDYMGFVEAFEVGC